MNIRREIDSISGILDKIVVFCCVALAFVMFAAVTMQIISRYFMPLPLPWTEELSRFCMIWMAFLGASSLVRSWENTAVTFVQERLPPKIRFFVDLFVKIIMLFTMAGLAILATNVLPQIAISEKSPAMMISMMIPKSSIIFGSLIVSLQLVWIIADTLLRVKEERS